MGPQEAPDLGAFGDIQIWRLLWLPAAPEAAFGRPLVEEHGGLRATSVGSVTPW